MSSVVPFLIAAAVLIAIRVIAGTNNIIGKMFRWFWNTSFKIAAHVPMCGWMAHFMIAKTPAEKAMKDKYLGIGAKTDEAIPSFGGSAGGFAQHYVGNGARLYLVSTYNHGAVLCNEATGQTVDVRIHNESDGTVSDGSGNLYYPD